MTDEGSWAPHTHAGEPVPLAWVRLLSAHATITRELSANLLAAYGLTASDYEVLLDAIEVRGWEFEQTKKFRDVAGSGRAAIVVDDLASTDPARVALAEGLGWGTMALVDHVQAAETAIGRDQRQCVDGAVDDGVGALLHADADRSGGQAGRRLMGCSPVAQRCCTA